MANELKHSSVGTELTQAEWEAVDGHVVNSQAVGDLLYAETTSSIQRLGIGSANDVLRVTGGKPDWQATSFITSLGTISTGVWQGTDVGVAYGGTGVSTLTANGVLIGNGSSAIGSIDMSTKGHILIGDGSGNPQMLGVGTNTHVLTADSGETTGVKWAAPAAAAAGSLTGSTLASGVTASSLTSLGTLAADTFTANGTGVVIGHTAKVSTSQASQFQLLGTAGPDSQQILGRWSANGGSAELNFIKSRNGTIGSSTIVENLDSILVIGAYADDGTDFAHKTADIHMGVNDASPAANQIGGDILFRTSTTSGTLTSRLKINSAGEIDLNSGDLLNIGASGNDWTSTLLSMQDTSLLKIGATSAHGSTAGTNLISLFNGTAPAGTLTNGASFFCASGEMKVIDAAGNVTVLSPHDDEGRWVFDSRDSVSGRVLRIQMEQMMRRLDEMLGGGFIEEFIAR